MGAEVERREFSRADRAAYRQKVRESLDVLARMLAGSRFSTAESLAGMEIELDLVDGRADPAMCNDEVLAAIADPAFQTELGQFNVEINVSPRGLAGAGLLGFSEQIRASLNAAEARAGGVGAGLVMIGILPTLRAEHLTSAALSSNPRYALLNEQIFAARGEDLTIDIEGIEKLSTMADTVAPEAACTSAQFHLQVTPARFGAYWNAAQAIAGVQVALGANSPYLLGRQLWQETRVPLFQQATDTRAEEIKAQGVRPRVWFGERWIDSVFDLFDENVHYFPALLPICQDEDAAAVLARGEAPELAELRLHNGTVYRWNRPIYDVSQGQAHLRVENRVLPAGPTVADTVANAAFYFGLVRVLASDDRPVWTQMSFSAAEENFHRAAREGIAAEQFWPGYGYLSATELVLRHLLPLAHQGLDEWGVDTSVRDQLLGIIAGRCVTGRNGATWQVAAVGRAVQLGRTEALRAMLTEYIAHMHTNTPVHEWPH